MAVDKEQRTRALRYKRPALASMGYEWLDSELREIAEACNDVAWYAQDDDALLAALDGDDEEAFEFRMMFSDLSTQCSALQSRLYELGQRDEDGAARTYNDCTVALIGNRYQTIGFDTLEEDYYSLTSYQQELAHTEAGKRLMRHTKAEILSIIGQSVGILVAFLDMRQRYDYLKAMLELYERETTEGQTYIAVKTGMLIRAVIFPVKLVDEKFVDQLGDIQRECRLLMERDRSQEEAQDTFQLTWTEEKPGESAP